VIPLSSVEDTVEAEAPVDERRQALLEALTGDLGEGLVGSHIRPGDELWIRVTRDAWFATAETLRERHRMRYFNFLSAIDWLPSPYGRELDAEVDTVVHGREERTPEPMVHGYAGGESRFQLFMRVNDVVDHQALIVKADVPDDDLRMPTISTVYAGANWHERETAEMYGIVFEGHPDLRNLYLPGEFEGHPLRKDFPLLSRRVKPWPGIVDVEPMPGEAADEEGEE
jgi:NADH-quinone oxidoreductase subunit C